MFLKIIPSLVTISTLVMHAPVHAQYVLKDGLRVTENSIADTTRVNTYNTLVTDFLRIDPEKSRSYCDSAIALGKKINFHKGVISALRHQGLSLASKGEYQEAKKSFRAALAIALEHVAGNNVSLVYNNLSTISNSLHDVDSALYFSQRSLALDSTDRNKKFVYSNLATSYRLKDDHAEALAYHLKNLALCRKSGDRNFESKILTNIGNLQAVMEHYSDALHYYKEAVRIYDTLNFAGYAQLNMNIGNAHSQMKAFAEAEKYYNNALALAKKFGMKSLSAQILQNMGNLHSRQDHFLLALQYYSESRPLATEIRDELMLTRLNLGFAFAYLHLNKLKESKREATEAVMRSERMDAKILQHKAYLALHNVDSVNKNYGEALDHYKRSQAIYDSVFSAERSKQIIEIQEKYESEKKAREIQELQHEVQKKQLQVVRQKDKLYAAVTLLVAMVCTIAFIHWKMKMKRERKAQEDTLQKHKEVILAQEDVQEKISRDLHDHIGQKLIALKMHLETDTVEEKPLLNRLALLDEINADIRNTSHSLSPYILQTEGLALAFEKLLNVLFSHSDTRYSFETFCLKSKYPHETEINLYRIGQELLTNVIKHAHARWVTVQLYENATHLVLMVEDDGSGMGKSFKKGFGFRNIEIRTKIVNGVFHVVSSNGRTTSTIRIPV